VSESPRVGWLPTPALSSALAVIACLPLLAVALSRPDLLIIALPILVSTVIGLFTRAYRLPKVALEVAAGTLLEGESTTVRWQLSGTEQLDLLQLRPNTEGWIELADGGAQFCTTVSPGRITEFDFPLLSTRWGRGQLDRVALTAYTAQGLLRADASVPVLASVRILPLREGFTATDAVPRAAGVVGLHRSRRVGDGVDLAGVRPFVAGDRLRRINWPVSTRTGQLHVTATQSDRDTEVVLVLDSTVELGESTGADGTSSTIDLAVRSAAAIAEHYLRNGDRVGVLDLSRPGRPIRSRSGRGQLDVLMELLLELRASPITGQAVERALARIRPNALVIVLSPLLTEEVATALAGLARAGRSIVIVDTLPGSIELPRHSDWTEVAWQLQMLHRDNLIGGLSGHGVPIVAWLGAGSLDAVLRNLSRTAAAPRALR
jgi:uncharacterized protein (DUF58 family)